MGRGDKKTKRGKIHAKSYGNIRSRKTIKAKNAKPKSKSK